MHPSLSLSLSLYDVYKEGVKKIFNRYSRSKINLEIASTPHKILILIMYMPHKIMTANLFDIFIINSIHTVCLINKLLGFSI